jgi:chromosome partitioning protein
MRTICIMNHKGGVGKTTTAVNLAAGISRNDKEVLLIDLDPQSNVSLSLNIDTSHNLYEALTGKIPIKDCIQHLGKNLDVITSSESLVKAEYYLSNQPNSALLLKELLGSISGYDYILVDCPPSLGVLNQNVLAFCKEIFIPTSTDFFGLDALKKMNVIVDKINDNYNHDIKITKIIPTLFDKRNKICKETLEEIRNDYPGVVSEPIRNNSKLKEAPKYGKSIFKYARSSPGAKDYAKLSDDVLEMGSLRIVQEAVVN